MPRPGKFREEELRTTHQKLPVRAVVVSKTWRPALPRVMGEELLALLPLAFKATERKCDEGTPNWSWNYEYVHRDEYARLENERDLLFRALQRQVATNPPAQPLPSIPGLITSSSASFFVKRKLLVKQRREFAVSALAYCPCKPKP
ncbi:hypothetical protein MY5147_008494 [Beauveria neobassiana]